MGLVLGLFFVPVTNSVSGQVSILEVVGNKYPITIDDQTFVIIYGYGGSFEVSEEQMVGPIPNLLSISLNPERKSLEIEFEKLIEASLFWIVAPPDLISADDYNFQVFVDGKETKYDLVIREIGPRIGFILPPNAEKVEIIGTNVIPEFGTVAMMILVVAIISIIALSTKTKTILRV